MEARVPTIRPILRVLRRGNMVDLLLVNPSSKLENYGPLTPFSAVEPPLWCALLAAYVRERGHSVAILDAEAEGLGVEDTAKRIVTANPLLTAIIVLGINPSVSSTPKMTAVTKLVKVLKKKAPDLKVLVGGLHPSALPERTLSETKADYVCQGEGFETLAGLMTALKAGQQEIYLPGLWWVRRDGLSFGGNPTPIDPEKLPMAAWDLLPMERYRAHNWQCLEDPERRGPYAMIYTSLGCPFTCSYCNIHALYGGIPRGQPHIRTRSAERVAEEVDHLVHTYGVRKFKFMDEMFALSPRRVIEVCNAIIRLHHDLDIWAYARTDTLDELMLHKMRAAGIRWVCIGFESASDAVRQGVAKKYRQDEIERAVRLCRKADVNIIANFMVGLPDDDADSMQATLDMAKLFNFEYINLYCAAAYPGSKLYTDAVRQGVRLPKKWSDYSQFSPDFIPLPTKHLTAEQVLEFRDRAFTEYFSDNRYLGMIKGKFGDKAVEHIRAMLGHKIRRTILERNEPPCGGSLKEKAR